MATICDPMSPVPPTITIFMLEPFTGNLLSTLPIAGGAAADDPAAREG